MCKYTTYNIDDAIFMLHCIHRRKYYGKKTKQTRITLKHTVIDAAHMIWIKMLVKCK